MKAETYASLLVSWNKDLDKGYDRKSECGVFMFRE